MTQLLKRFSDIQYFVFNTNTSDEFFKLLKFKDRDNDELDTANDFQKKISNMYNLFQNNTKGWHHFNNIFKVDVNIYTLFELERVRGAINDEDIAKNCVQTITDLVAKDLCSLIYSRINS
jgi:hypothetical protein